MQVLTRLFRLLAVAMLAAAPSLARAQDGVIDPADAPWQAVITGQIEAFRQKDAPAAFSFAGESFQRSFPSAAAFFHAIVSSGYAPIMTSRTHTFGKYVMLGEHEVGQEVTLVGPRQELYRALYQLAEEPAGWRVQGVMLTAPVGVGI